MTTTLTFDTLHFVNRLKKAGIPADHAEAEAEALSEIFQSNTDKLAMKEDVIHLEERVDSKFELLRKDIDLVRKDIDLVRKDAQAMQLRTITVLGSIVVTSVSTLGIALGVLQHLH
jgi:hypothetical protein